MGARSLNPPLKCPVAKCPHVNVYLAYSLALNTAMYIRYTLSLEPRTASRFRAGVLAPGTGSE